MGTEQSGRRSTIALLAVGCLAVATAVLVARGAPASGYEPNIYGATPALFWVAIGVAWVVSAAVAIGTADPIRRAVATGIGGLGATAFVGLPLLRGYHFFGTADSLSHLGWVRDLGAGRIAATDLFYPGMHSVAVMTSDALGIGYPRATMLAVLALLIGFFLAVPAAVWTLTGDGRAAAVGAFSAFMLLPMNVVVTQPVLHPISQAALFVAVTVYLLARYLCSEAGDRRLSVTPVGVLLATATTALVLYHPQAAVAVLLLIGTGAGVQLVARRLFPDGPVAGLRPVYAQSLLLAAVFFGWSWGQTAFRNTLDLLVRTLLAAVSGRSPPVADTVTERGGSLAALGAGLPEIYLKLFLVSTVYVLLAGGLFLWSYLATDRRVTGDTDGVVRILGIGLVPLAVLTTAHFLGPLSRLVFRYVSVAMTVVTVLGAVAVYRVALRDGPREPGSSPYGSAALVVVVLVLFGLSVPAVFASPYVYQPSSHVSEAQLAGYEASFDDAQPETEFVGIRWADWRYRHAVEGTAGNPWGGETLPPGAIDESLSTNATADRYVVVTRFDYEREVSVYRELRYTREHFGTVATQPGIDRVRSNGEFQLYYDRGEGAAG